MLILFTSSADGDGVTGLEWVVKRRFGDTGITTQQYCQLFFTVVNSTNDATDFVKALYMIIYTAEGELLVKVKEEESRIGRYFFPLWLSAKLSNFLHRSSRSLSFFFSLKMVSKIEYLIPTDNNKTVCATK